MRIFSMLAAAAVVLLGGAAASYAGPPFPLRDTLKFGPDSDFALVVFEAEPQVIVPRWKLELFSFSLEERRWTYGLTTGWAHFPDVPGGEGRDFYASLVKPAGIYAVNRISSQSFWDGCLNGGTKAFAIEAGKVNFIGRIDPTLNLLQIATQLPQASRNGQHLFLFDTPRLALTPPSQREHWQEDVTAFLATRFPRVNAPLVGPEPIDTTFDAGHSIVAGKICEKY